MNLRNLWSWLKAEFRWRVLGKRYEVILTEEAQMQLDELPEHAQAEIRKAMERISRNPYTSDSHPFGLHWSSVISYIVVSLHRSSFESFLEWLKEKGITDRNRAREILDDLIEMGLAEGDDEIGYILTEKGAVEAEKKIFGDVGVV